MRKEKRYRFFLFFFFYLKLFLEEPSMKLIIIFNLVEAIFSKSNVINFQRHFLFFTKETLLFIGSFKDPMKSKIDRSSYSMNIFELVRYGSNKIQFCILTRILKYFRKNIQPRFCDCLS